MGGYDITYNALDFAGKPTATLKTHGISGASDTYKEYYTYTYDKAQRLTSTTHKLGDSGSPVTLASNSYDPLGRLQTKTLGGVAATTYSYNVRSWVSGISGSRFTENLYYNQNTASLPNFTASYNGNIAGMQWSVPSESLGYNRAYTFAYDGLNRLTTGKYCGFNGSVASGTLDKYTETMDYDRMGNIQHLNRNENGSGLNQLTLNYTGNQLLNVSDALAVVKPYGSEAFDNKASLSTEYLYDTNGSMTYDANSGISTIQYNVLNLPNIVQFTAGHKNIYTYGADGKKLEINNYTLRSAINVPQGSISTLPSNPGDYTKVTTDYIGNMVYENGALKEILLPEGYWQSGVYYYYLKDHLGDNRVTINSSGTVIEKSHYYPSGMRFYPESSSNSAALPYRYNGKELEAMNGLNQYDYGARRRFAGIPVWPSFDPLSENHFDTSPYVVCGDNLLNRVDPNGKDWVITISKDGNGNWNIQITVNAAIIDKSGKGINMQNYIAEQKTQFERIFSMKRTGFTITSTLNMREIKNEKEVKGKEHLVLLEPFDESMKDYTGYADHYGGLKVHMNSNYINNDGTTDHNDLPHEFGHTGGLVHPWDPDQVDFNKGYFSDIFNRQMIPTYNQKMVNKEANFMSYPDKYIDSNLSDGAKRIRSIYLNPGSATRGQLASILRYYQQGLLNKDDR